ncbi:hypothetical protein [Commensalibacter communis]|uniref:hypothetical protein n=1 Tax=Commensalibacter communis TaxID=2972786 RepID=UPI00232FDF06|nr:hypothetical protein [Commensalibacter communis]
MAFVDTTYAIGAGCTNLEPAYKLFYKAMRSFGFLRGIVDHPQLPPPVTIINCFLHPMKTKKINKTELFYKDICFFSVFSLKNNFAPAPLEVGVYFLPFILGSSLKWQRKNL